MMTDSRFYISSFLNHKRGVIRRQAVAKPASSWLALESSIHSWKRAAMPPTFSRGSGEDLKNKGSPLCLEKSIKFSRRKSCTKFRNHSTHTQITRSTRKSFTNHPQGIRNTSTRSDPNHHNSPIPHHPQQRGGLCEACRIFDPSGTGLAPA